MTVNPWFFYLLNICESISNASLITLLIGGVSLAAVFIDYSFSSDNGKELKKTLRNIFIILAVAALVYVFVPS